MYPSMSAFRSVVAWERGYAEEAMHDVDVSLVPRPFPPPVFDRILYAKTGGGNGLGTRLA